MQIPQALWSVEVGVAESGDAKAQGGGLRGSAHSLSTIFAGLRGQVPSSYKSAGQVVAALTHD